jgi:hypothetical protein
LANSDLNKAKKDKQDEFYTQYEDIEKEMNSYLEYDPKVFEEKSVLLPCDDPEWSNFTKYFAQNFEKLKLRKLISTSFAADSKVMELVKQPTLFEVDSPQFDADKTRSRGKIFELSRDQNKDQRIDVNDLEWKYLEGKGDFQSPEVKKLRDEADVIVTNPPFSKFRPFLNWIMEANKEFVIMGNQNSITTKKVFPYFKSGQIWLGPSISSGDREFEVPEEYPLEAATSRVDESGRKFLRIKGVRWFTNLEHGRRHQPLPLMTLEDNIKYSKHKEVKGVGYPKYDNFNAIHIRFTDSIPSDFEGVMGVPISFLDKYSPEQFELIGLTGDPSVTDEYKIYPYIKHDRPYLNGKRQYPRLLIRHRGR